MRYSPGVRVLTLYIHSVFVYNQAGTLQHTPGRDRTITVYMKDTMIYGITGNVTKEEIWTPIAAFVSWLRASTIPFVLNQPIGTGLAERKLLSNDVAHFHSRANFAHESEVILSFGGDGTLLMTAHEVGARETPILGVNMGRLGFLADTEVNQLKDTVMRLDKGEYRIESRMVLEARYTRGEARETQWAVNDFVIGRSEKPQLISIEVSVDGAHLTNYWADGLIIATPTGSTAYSLSVGGPILVPGCGNMVLTPIAPHTLTVRPIVLPDSAVITVHVPAASFMLATDGRSTYFEEPAELLTIRRAQHSVKLIKLPEQDYFHTLRSKLRWSGA